MKNSKFIPVVCELVRNPNGFSIKLDTYLQLKFCLHINSEESMILLIHFYNFYGL